LAAVSAVVAATILLSGCGLSRNPVPLDRISDGQLPGFSDVRRWGSQYRPDVKMGADPWSDCSVLALSGGGASGAFGAGFLNGWTASGTRPTFRVVTGISTGSLIAPLAFLGPDYDAELKEFYTHTRTRDILHIQGLFGALWRAITGESVASTAPLQKLIAQLAREDTLAAIAREHARGRRLYIGSTNLDAQQLVLWDMGAIASSGHPDALKLFRKVMLASASIPGAFPPVYFEVEVDGRRYDEMHVDGGVITGVFGIGRLSAEQVETAEREGPCSCYVIRNGRLDAEPVQVARSTLKIAMRSLSTVMTTLLWEDLSRIYVLAREGKIDFNYVSLPHDYESHSKEPFDPGEMTRLFEMGYAMAKDGYRWNKTLPVFKSPLEDRSVWTE